MGVDDSQKQLKKTASNRLQKQNGLKKKKRMYENKENEFSELVQNEEIIHKEKEEKKNKSSRKKKRKGESKSKVDAEKLNLDQITIGDKSDGRKKKCKSLSYKLRKANNIAEIESSKVGDTYDHLEDASDEHLGANEAGEKKRRKLKRKRRKNEKMNESKVDRVNMHHLGVEEGSDQRYDDGKTGTVQSEFLGQTENFEGREDVGKSKKAHKKNKKNHSSSKQHEKMFEKGEVEQDEVYQISSGDEDCTRGVKKWIMEYHQRKPGLKILQERVDDFITAHEAKEEQVRKERVAQAAEGGWTVVVHNKGRKKTTDSESGIAVGSVAPAAVMDKLAKRKDKEVLLDFYRFQRREAQRNEIMMLQSKFEEDKKRIQQLRASRKFRPY